MIAIDTETRDPGLLTQGPGDKRGTGEIIGVSWSDMYSEEYIPLLSEGRRIEDYDNNVSRIRDICQNKETKVFANAAYDMAWLKTIGVSVNGRIYDVIIREALIDEYAPSYGLDALGKKYTGEGKYEHEIEDWMASHGIAPNKVKENLHLLNANILSRYAAMDAKLTRFVFNAQEKEIASQELGEVNTLESDLIPVIFAMRDRGIRVDLEKAYKAMENITKMQEETLSTLNYINVWSQTEIAEMADRLQLPYERTEKGLPSFAASWLEVQTHPFYQDLLRARKLDRLGNVFIQSKIIDASVNGRLYPNYRQTTSDYGGTKWGRLSSSNPNFQQFPARDSELATMVRGLLIADPGEIWAVFDYSQQEPRIMVDYAYKCGMKGAAEVLADYINNPSADYHQMTTDMVNRVSNKNFDRKIIKQINLAISYGMGKLLLSQKLGLSMEQTLEVLKAYNSTLPYVKELTNMACGIAKKRGFVKTRLGRRARFPKGGEHVAINRIVQGTAADMVKMALVKLYKAGYTPCGTIHDEIDFSIPKSTIPHIRDIMLDAMEFDVPHKVDIELGPDWGHCELM